MAPGRLAQGKLKCKLEKARATASQPEGVAGGA